MPRTSFPPEEKQEKKKKIYNRYRKTSEIVRKLARPILKHKMKNAGHRSKKEQQEFHVRSMLREVLGMNPTGKLGLYYSKCDDHVFNYGLLGATEEEMAAFLGISAETFNEWKRDHPSFAEAIAASKGPADARVAQATFNRAIGYSHPSEEINVYFGRVIRTPTIKHYPPDVTAQKYWLNNRRRQDWSEKVTPGDGSDDVPPPTKVEVVIKDARIKKRDEDPKK